MPAANAPALLSCQAALDAVRAHFPAHPPTQVETVPLADAANRVLAAPVHADRDQPPFARSTRDGYAVRAADTVTGIQAEFQICGAIRAGELWTGPPLQPGEAIDITTGAPVPAGADAVLMLEHASQHGTRLRPSPGRTLTPGENIVAQAAEARGGDTVLHPGTRLGAAEIALAASVGHPVLPVFAQPVVAILSTGDELVDIATEPAPQQIRNSNAYALAALVRQNGGIPRILPIVADTRAALDTAIASTADAAMLLLSGGVSAGKYDLVEPALLARGARFFFTGVALQPGKPAVFGYLPAQEALASGIDHGPTEPAALAAGMRNLPAASKSKDGTEEAAEDQWIFGLPGNPISTQVTAMLFAMPMLRALGGEHHPHPHFAQATLAEPLTNRPGLTRFLPARLQATLHATTVRPTGWQGSGDLQSNARANCYLVVPEHTGNLPAGSPVSILLR